MVFPTLPLKTLELKNLNHIFIIILVVSVILGSSTGFLLAKNNTNMVGSNLTPNEQPKNAASDNRTFRDFAEGVIQKRPKPKNPAEYVEGTHLLVREGAVSVALTSSVVDLSQYEGKKVRVLGETQKAIKEGWLMDVGKVEAKN